MSFFIILPIAGLVPEKPLNSLAVASLGRRYMNNHPFRTNKFSTFLIWDPIRRLKQKG